MFFKMFQSVFFLSVLFFLKTHVIQASLVDGVLTLPKQCESCVKLQSELDLLQEARNKVWEERFEAYKAEEQIAKLVGVAVAEAENISSQTFLEQKLVEALKKLQEQNTKLKCTIIQVLVDNKLLNDQNNNLCADWNELLSSEDTIKSLAGLVTKENDTLKEEVRNLTISNTKLTEDLKKKMIVLK